jgi:anti-anti-sigma factor
VRGVVITMTEPSDDPPEFSTEVVRDGEAVVIFVRGEIDMETAGHLRDAIEPHLGPQQTIVLNLSEVAFVDSTCVTVLVHARGCRLRTADHYSFGIRRLPHIDACH